jgi:hypothetical protein
LTSDNLTIGLEIPSKKIEIIPISERKLKRRGIPKNG